MVNKLRLMLKETIQLGQELQKDRDIPLKELFRLMMAGMILKGWKRKAGKS